MNLSEKKMYKGWLPVDDEVDDSDQDELRLHLESIVAVVAVPANTCDDAWSGVITGLHALSIASQSAHWRALGDSFYSDHLMYQRMYEDISKEIDAVGEKYVGVTGNESIIEPNRLISALSSAGQQMLAGGDVLETLLRAQRNFIKRVSTLVKLLEASGQYSSGIDNLLSGIIDKHEEHIYLLERRLKAASLKACVKNV